MKALVFGDLHLHAHKDRVDRLEHCLEVLDWIFKTTIKEKCKHIFFLGDLFHERSKIDVLNYLKTFEIFIKYMSDQSNDINMHLLVGNHDMYHKERWDINSIKPLTAIPRVHIVDKPTRMEIGGRKIDWMPHTDNPIKELSLLKESNNGAGDILFGHMAVHGAKLNIMYGTKSDVIVEYDNDMTPVDYKIFDDWSMTMLGHYHSAQNFSSKGEYIGSPLELTYGDAFQKKHIAIINLETMEKIYIENKFSPKHLILTPQDVVDENYNLDGNFIRIATDSLKSKETVDIKRQIAKNYKVLSIDAKPKENKVKEDSTVIHDAVSILQDTKQMLVNYIKEKGIPEGLTGDKLLKIGNKCLEKKI